MAKNEVAVVKFEVAAIEPDFLEVIQEEMQGLGELPMETIKIPSGGGIAFEVPTDDPDNPDMAKDITGVIVAHQPQNTYWAQGYSGEATIPVCISSDGSTGIVTATGEVRQCSGCPMNQFGSATDAQGRQTRGKACKNAHRLFILREGELLPVIINIPSSSIAEWKSYISKRLLLKRKRPHQVITKISLRKATNKDGITFSQCVFSKVADLDVNTIKQVEPMIELTKKIMVNQNQRAVEMSREKANNDQCVEAEAVFVDPLVKVQAKEKAEENSGEQVKFDEVIPF